MYVSVTQRVPRGNQVVLTSYTPERQVSFFCPRSPSTAFFSFIRNFRRSRLTRSCSHSLVCACSTNSVYNLLSGESSRKVICRPFTLAQALEKRLMNFMFCYLSKQSMRATGNHKDRCVGGTRTHTCVGGI